MKIYKRKEFLNLPVGTAYHKGDYSWFGDLEFKGESWLECNDFYRLSIGWVDGRDADECFDRLFEMKDEGASYPLQQNECRDGLFEDDAIFMVYEKSDLHILKELVERALEVSE